MKPSLRVLMPLASMLLGASAGCLDPFPPPVQPAGCRSDWDCPVPTTCDSRTRTCRGAKVDLGAPVDLASGPDLAGPRPDLAGLPAGAFRWVRRLGGAGLDSAYAVATDSRGNVVVAGSFQGTVDLGGGALMSAGQSDIFVAKFASDGAPLWSQRVGGSGDDQAYGLAVDATGDVVVTGAFQGTIRFGGSPLQSAGDYDVVAFKLSSTGALRWARRYGGSGADAASSAAVDASGNVFLTGYFSGAAAFGGATLQSAGQADIFLTKLSGDGNALWAQRAGGPADDIGGRVATDALGNALVTGQFSGTARFAAGALTSAGESDVFLAKYSSAGAGVWLKRFGGSASDVGNGVTVDRDGAVTVVGAFQGRADFGGGPLFATSTSDVFLARLRADGSHAWSRRLGGAEPTTGTSVAAARDGSLVIVGSANGDVDLGGGAMPGGGVFAARFESDGALRWARNFPGSNNQSGLGAAIDPEDAVLMVGEFQGTVDHGAGALDSAGQSDGFVLKLTP